MKTFEIDAHGVFRVVVVKLYYETKHALKRHLNSIYEVL